MNSQSSISESLKSAIQKMVDIFNRYQYSNWANRFLKIQRTIEFDEPQGIREVLSLYGGMGSLNDVVLHREGVPLVAENNELEELKTVLHELCVRKSRS